MRRVLLAAIAVVCLGITGAAQTTTVRWALAPFGKYPNAAGRLVFTSKMFVYAPLDSQVAASNVGTNAAAGITKKQWCLVVVKAWPPEAEADSQIIFLPALRMGEDVGEDAQLIVSALAQTDIAVAVNPTDSFRQVLMRIAKQALENSSEWAPETYMTF